MLATLSSRTRSHLTLRLSMTHHASRVHEHLAHYEDEGSVREARGAVGVPGGAWWSAALAVSIGREDDCLVRLTRHGAGDPTSHAERIDLRVPESELDALVTLLSGVVAQARRDAVLPPASPLTGDGG